MEGGGAAAVVVVVGEGLVSEVPCVHYRPSHPSVPWSQVAAAAAAAGGS